MNCLEFRRLAGAEPARRSPEIDEHVRTCPACAEFAQQMRALDRRLHQALSVAVPARAGRVPFLARAFSMPRQWALAASLVVAVVAASLVWIAFPRATLAQDVIAHASHEPESWDTQGVEVPASAVAYALRGSGIEQAPQLGRVSYVRRCWFRGHFVPHLVVQDETGPIMVLVLTEETVSDRVRFAEGGYSGVILPARGGSIAVLALADARVDVAAERVLQALR